MVGNDDPFFSTSASDRTVIRPIPGGRVQDIPKNTEVFFTEKMQATPLQHLGKLNPLENAASALLALAANLYSRASHPAPGRLKQQLANEIKMFHTNASQAGIDRETIQHASHALCTALDEAIFNTPWGQQSGWTEQSLLSEFHHSVAGGEEFFYKLKELGQNPAKNLHLLELMYICLAVGFQGRYRLVEGGKDKLAQVRAWLGQLIRQQCGTAEKMLSPHWKGVAVQNKGLTRIIPLWVFYSLASGVLLALFLGLLFALAAYASPVKARIAQMDFSATATPTAKTSTDIAWLPTLRQLLATEIRQGLVNVRDKNGHPVIELSGDKGLFASNSDVLIEERVSLVKRIADILASSGQFAQRSFTLQGHTDNVPIRNPLRFQDNYELSTARAKTVQRLMLEQQASLHLSTLGKGASDPIADNTTKEGRAHNRRVEIVLD